MPQPATPLPRASTPNRRVIRLALWTALLAGICLLNLVRCGRSPSNTAVAVTNAAGAVSLADFTQAETHRWRTAPSGTQVWDGVTFVCNGAIRTAGFKAARDGNLYPGAVLGVPVNRSGSRIHLLQAAENSTEVIDGTPYGRIVLHYTSGESRQIELLFGIHGHDWLQGKNALSEPVADPNSKVAWLQRRTGDRMLLRLYHTVLENPLPNVTIREIDFISPLFDPNLLLFGLTIDNDSGPLEPSYGPGETIADTVSDRITFTLQDTSGQPASGAKLVWTAVAPHGRIDFPAFTADSQGQIRIEVPRTIREIRYTAFASDRSGTAGELKSGPGGVFPSNPVVKLSQGGAGL